MSVSMFGKRILILVPHPDDEVVGFAAIIGRAQREGAEVFALYLTNGCIAQDTLWPWRRKRYGAYVSRRRAEAEQVARLLNIAPAGWSDRPARNLWRNLQEVYSEVAQAVENYKIDQLWLPAYEGGNADHDGLNAVGQAFTTRLSVLEFAEYNFNGGKARAQEFPASYGAEQLVMLATDEQARKLALLKIYASEKNNLGYVEVVRECFRPLAAYDYAKPPHDGTLWYERFQWVPFRHPRVDFTGHEEVSAAIADFMNWRLSACQG